MVQINISYECKCRFDGKKYNSDKWCNNDKCRYGCKKRHVCEKDYVWNLATSNSENGKYFASIMDHSVIICDENTESYGETKLFEQVLMKRKQPVKCNIFILYLHFY